MKPNASELIQKPLDLYPHATVACFDPLTGELPRRRIDSELTKKFLQRLVNAGAESLLIGASTGQGHLRSIDELSEWFAVAAEADLSSAWLIALLRPEDGEAANQRLVRELAEHKYDIVFIRPGTDLAPDADAAAVAENIRPTLEFCHAANLPVGVYSIPDVSGLPLTPDAIARLLQIPAGENLVAIKVTEADYDKSTARMLADPRLSGLKIVQGWDPHLAQALRDNPRRCGVTSGAMSLAIFQYLHIFQLARDQQWAQLSRAQAAVTVLFQSMQDDPNQFANLQVAKCRMGLGHPLTAEIQPSQLERLENALQAIHDSEDRDRLQKSLDLML